jgi:hypothetical protein
MELTEYNRKLLKELFHTLIFPNFVKFINKYPGKTSDVLKGELYTITRRYIPLEYLNFLSLTARDIITLMINDKDNTVLYIEFNLSSKYKAPEITSFLNECASTYDFKRALYEIKINNIIETITDYKTQH